MNRIATLLATAAVTAATVAPAFALTIDNTAVLAPSPEDMSTVKMVEDSAFIGNEVQTNDQKVIGRVEGVSMDATGNQVVYVTLNADVAAQSSVKSFAVTVPSDMTADGSLTLGWNQDELYRALSSNLDTDTTDSSNDGAGTDTSGEGSGTGTTGSGG